MARRPNRHSDAWNRLVAVYADDSGEPGDLIRIRNPGNTILNSDGRRWEISIASPELARNSPVGRIEEGAVGSMR